MSTLSEGELHVQAMRLVCEALADREKTGLEVDWDVLCHMHDHMDVIFRGIEDQRRDDQDELMHTRKDRDHWKQARQEAHEAGELMKAEIETLRKQLADAQRAVSDAFAEVNSVREQLNAARSEIETLKGAMAADDQRLRAAEERIWPGMTWGCDAAEKMADEILHLRHSLKVAQADNVMLSKWLSEETDRHRATNAEKIKLFEHKEWANKHNADLQRQLTAAQAAVTLQRAGIERLSTCVGKVRTEVLRYQPWSEALNRITAALAELDAGTEPTTVAEPLDVEGGA